MPSAPTNAMMQHIRGLVEARCPETLTDRELLSRFVQDQDGQAFAALVHRHGPMVLRVGRRLLQHEQDAEDVFQAAFLVLSRKAHANSTRWQPSIGNWLYGVAHRLALEARRRAARRRSRAAGTGPTQAADPLDELSVREAQLLLDEELSRLPEKLRSPVVLCCLEGLSREEAARRLGWPASLVKSRLEQGRQRLAFRLAQRGLTPTAALAATLLTEGTRSAAVAPTLANSTMRAAVAFGTGTATGTISAPVVALAEGAMGAVSAMKLKSACVLLLMICMAGAGAMAWQAPAGGPGAQEGAPPAGPASGVRMDRYGDPLPPGATRRLGTVRFRHGDAISEVRFSTDGKTLVSRAWQQSVSFWDPATGRELRRVLLERDQRLLALSPDGKLLVCCKGDDGPLCLRDLATGKVLRRFAGDPGRTFHAAFSPDNQTLVAAAQDATIRFWAVATGEELRRTAPQAGPTMALAFTRDGKTFASGRGDGTITLWETPTGRQLRSPEKQGQFISALAFSPDGKLLAWGSSTLNSGRIWLWDVRAGKEVRHLKGHPSQIGGLAFSPDGKYLVSGGGRDDGSVRLWDVATGREVWQTPAHSHWPVAFAFSPDGKTLASGSTDGTVGVWDMATGKDLRPPADGHFAAVNGLALSPDGRTLASGSWDRTIRLWDPAAGAERRRLTGHTDNVFGLAFSPDGRLLASTSYDSSVRLWDPATGKELHCLRGHKGMVFTVAFAPDGRTLASGGADGTARLWDQATGKELVQLKGPMQGINRVAFSPDGHLLAGCSNDATAAIWERASGKELLQLKGHEHPWVHCVAISPDGRTLASGSEDRTIRLWDVRTGEERGRLTGHEALVGSLALTPDGRTLISTSYDQTIRLWELATSKERRRFRVDRGWPRAVVLAPDRRTLYSSGEDSTLLVWDIYYPPANGLPQAAKLTADQERALWTDLQSMDARQAFRAESALLAAPEQAVALLRERLRPTVRPDAQRLDRLLADLDSSEFAVRAKATAELEALGDLAEATLRKALEGQPSVEVRRRVEGLLKKVGGTIPDPETLRTLRALEVLEQIGTPEAARVLKTMTGGADEALVTREAKESVRRLAGQSQPKP
jgi:RNA polymerase sigma factor (sigma-70 family)